MNINYVANIDNFYGENIHTCIAGIPEDVGIKEDLLNQFQLVLTIDENTLSSDIRSYPDLLVIDNNTIREKNENEKIIDLRVVKLNELKQAYENQLRLGYDTSLGIKVDCKPDDISNWTATLKLLDLIPSLETVSIGDYYNDSHTLTIDQYKQLCIETGIYYNSLFGKKWTLRKQIEECTSLTELINIGW